MKDSFKKKYQNANNFEKRLNMTKDLKKNFPNKYPIIVEESNSNGKFLKKNKYICPGHLTCSEFMIIIRKNTSLAPDESLYLFAGNSIPKLTSIISHIHSTHKEKDGILYLSVSKESTFGFQ